MTQIKILFVCHGNICRSTMAEGLLKYLLEKNNIKGVTVESAATSTEEIGSPVHHGTVSCLRKHGVEPDIYLNGKRARQINTSDLSAFDVIIGMDAANINNMKRFYGKNDKLRLLNSYNGETRDVADPWYTHDFEATYDDLMRGLVVIIDRIKNNVEL